MPIVSGFGRRGFGVVITGGARKAGIARTDTDSGPIGAKSLIIYVFKTRAVIERISTDIRYALRYNYALNTRASSERIRAYTVYAIS